MNNIDVVEICKRFGVSYPKNVNRVIEVRSALNIFKDNETVFNYLLDKYVEYMCLKKDREMRQMKTDIESLKDDNLDLQEELKSLNDLKNKNNDLTRYNERLGSHNKEMEEKIRIRDQEINELKNAFSEAYNKNQMFNSEAYRKRVDLSTTVSETKNLLICFLIVVLIIICIVILSIPVNNLNDARESEEYKYYDKYRLHKRYESIF